MQVVGKIAIPIVIYPIAPRGLEIWTNLQKIDLDGD